MGRPLNPPPYSELVRIPPREGPPPPYCSVENLALEQQPSTLPSGDSSEPPPPATNSAGSGSSTNPNPSSSAITSVTPPSDRLRYRTQQEQEGPSGANNYEDSSHVTAEPDDQADESRSVAEPLLQREGDRRQPGQRDAANEEGHGSSNSNTNLVNSANNDRALSSQSNGSETTSSTNE
jgi:hypothetical protein